MAEFELEIKFQTLTDTAAKITKRLQYLEDVAAVTKLHHAYGHYLEHWDAEEIIGLFSHSDEVSVEIHDTGLYKGWEAVEKSFHFADHYTAFNGRKTAPPEFLHILILKFAGHNDQKTP